MTSLHDIPLPHPLPETLLRGLLFGSFVLHLLFVLMMLGTAILALSYFIHAWWHGRLGELRWDKNLLRMFLMHKSLAVVLGVAPLLLIQVGFSIPFFTAVVLLSPFWLLIILFLIVSFVSFDSLGHKIYVHRFLHLGLGIVAMIALLCVPGFFVAVLTAAENPEQWTDIVFSGFGFDWRLSLHWLFRYLHVLGAAVVFGAAFHYFFLARGPRTDKKPALAQWMLLGLLLQVGTGVPLYWSLLRAPTPAIFVFLFIGTALMAVLIWLVAWTNRLGKQLHGVAVMPMLMTLLVAMLLARQGFQDKGFAQTATQLSRPSEEYRGALAPYQELALSQYRQFLALDYSSGATIFAQSCAFCHGTDARGRGPDADYLDIPPEDLSAIRARRTYIEAVLARGVLGTAMPRFGYYDDLQRRSVLDFLNKQYGIFASPPKPTYAVSALTLSEAQTQWSSVCSACHGPDGGVSKMAAAFRPAPPDLRRYGLTPDRAFDVITRGYPGTQMPAFGALDEAVRWGLVEVVRSKQVDASIDSRGD